MVAQGEIWLLETPNAKQRPVLVVSRNEALPHLNNIVVAPITSTLRSIPTCIPVGKAEGLRHSSVASFDNLTTIPKMFLTVRLGSLNHESSLLFCDALRSMADC